MFKPYKYVKEEPVKIEKRLEFPKFNFRKLTSMLLVVGGFFLLADQIILPFLTASPAQKPLLKPTSPTVAGASSKIEVGFEFTELKQEPGTKIQEVSKSAPKIFYLTIPKLGIEKAEVETNSEKLSPDELLGHYPGSALPGEPGNTFIYGHSVLPMFYNPKNYRTIFSTLDELEEGDEIIVEFGEKLFKYVVEKWAVLNPEDVKPLEPIGSPFLNQSYLTLMTCVPMGVGTNRLLVQARLAL